MNEKKESSLVTAQIAVIGCSNTNPSCDHNLHPSSDDFCCIDIDKTIQPDYHMDITKKDIPATLQKHFKLTVLEYLPYDVYNRDELKFKYLNIDGEKGMRNVINLTDENGFIMIVGNSRRVPFRKCVSQLNYMEIASAEDDTYDTYYVLLIPLNQKLTCSEVKEELLRLPEPLKKCIDYTVNNKGFHPSEPDDFCTLNFCPSEENKEMIRELNSYATIRGYGKKYNLSLNFIVKRYDFGIPKDEKIKAALQVINVLLGNDPVESLENHKRALNDGRLKKLMDRHLKGRPIEELICRPNLSDSSEKVQNNNSSFKKRLNDIKDTVGNKKSAAAEKSSSEEKVKNKMSKF